MEEPDTKIIKKESAKTKIDFPTFLGSVVLAGATGSFILFLIFYIAAF
jgi:hypothetical protein